MLRHIYLTLFILLFSCDSGSTKNDVINNRSVEIDKTTLEGRWYLRSVNGGLAGVHKEYKQEDVVWNFKPDSFVDVTKNTIEHFTSILNGTHMYHIDQTNGNYYLQVGDIELGKIEIIDNHVVIDRNVLSNSSGADNYIFKLKKL